MYLLDVYVDDCMFVYAHVILHAISYADFIDACKIMHLIAKGNIRSEIQSIFLHSLQN